MPKMSNRFYDAMVYIAQIALPAIAAFYVAVAKIWNFPYPGEIAGTIAAVDTLMGALLKISSVQYHKEQEIAANVGE